MINGLHHYALEVPDLDVADGFLQDFGLETAEKDGSLVAQCPGRDQEQVRLVEAPASGCTTSRSPCTRTRWTPFRSHWNAPVRR